MTVYKTELLPKVEVAIDEFEELGGTFSGYIHDNFCNGSQPSEELDTHIGPGLWSQYPGPPCRKRLRGETTPSGRPKTVAKDRCECESNQDYSIAQTHLI